MSSIELLEYKYYAEDTVLATRANSNPKTSGLCSTVLQFLVGKILNVLVIHM